MATIKLLGVSADLATANNVALATFVRVVNTGAGEHTLTVANTVGPENDGGKAGSVVVEAGASEIIVKQPTDTIIAHSDVKATPVARY